MEVSIDQTLCRGDCICELICPQVFVLDDEGIAHVSTDEVLLDSEVWATVPEGIEAQVLDATNECPAQAISVRGSGTTGTLEP